MIWQSLSPSTHKIHAPLLFFMRKMKWHWSDGMWAKRFKVKGVRVCVDNWGRVSLRQLLGPGGGGGCKGGSEHEPETWHVSKGQVLGVPAQAWESTLGALGWSTHCQCVAEITLGPRLDTTTTIEAGISCSMVALTTITTTWSWIKNLHRSTLVPW
jgi:hypothetical protein